MNEYHVMPAFDRPGWAVRRTGARRATKIHPEKQDAIEDAKRRGDVVYVHRKDGMVENRIER